MCLGLFIASLLDRMIGVDHIRSARVAPVPLARHGLSQTLLPASSPARQPPAPTQFGSPPRPKTEPRQR